ncbi:MAG: GntR family transcriptional regulator [Alphaproteobacteria bacterium]|nr:GntR family transcriptional regulator [Alphaproteobacteria bacterium]
MDGAPDFRPLYQQVRDLLVQRIVDGAWKPGDALPPEPALAENYRVSQGTVRKALDELEKRNLVVRRQGKGTFVATHTPQRALFHFFHLVGDDGERALPSHRMLSVRSARADAREADRLALKPGTAVVRLKRLRLLGARVALVERIAVPAALFPGLADSRHADLPNELYRHYEIVFGVTVARAVERLKAVAATAEEAASLGLAPRAPLLEIDRVAFGLDGKPVEWRRSRCDTASHHYLSEIV